MASLLVNLPVPMKYRPPWDEPYIIGIAGFSGLGKTLVSQQIIGHINQPWTVLLLFDNFYNPLSPEELAQAFANNFDFDTPHLYDMELMIQTVRDLKRGKRVQIPLYSFTTHNRTDRIISLYGTNVIIIEGIYALYEPRLLEMMDLKVFVDTDLDICLARRLTRDILCRGRDLPGLLQQWERFVKPNALKFVAPTAANADLVIPRGLDNTIAIDLMIKHIKTQLAAKLLQHLQQLRRLGQDIALPEANLRVLPQTNQVVGINLILLAEATARDDFIFYFNRMSRLLIEEACQTFLADCTVPRVVTTPDHYQFNGVADTHELMVVLVIPLGDCFDSSIRKAFRGAPVGKMLIQLDSTTGEPQLHYQLIPRLTTKPRKVMLVDAQIILGAAAIMAIQILVDHKIRPDDIVLVTYLCTEMGLRRIFHAFPEVKVVVGQLLKVGEDILHTRERLIDKIYFGS